MQTKRKQPSERTLPSALWQPGGKDVNTMKVEVEKAHSFYSAPTWAKHSRSDLGLAVTFIQGCRQFLIGVVGGRLPSSLCGVKKARAVRSDGPLKECWLFAAEPAGQSIAKSNQHLDASENVAVPHGKAFGSKPEHGVGGGAA